MNRPYDLHRFSTVGEGSPLPRFNKSKTVCIVILERSEGSADGFLHFLFFIICGRFVNRPYRFAPLPHRRGRRLDDPPFPMAPSLRGLPSETGGGECGTYGYSFATDKPLYIILPQSPTAPRGRAVPSVCVADISPLCGESPSRRWPLTVDRCLSRLPR